MAPKVPKVAGLKRCRLTAKSPVADYPRVPLELGNGPVPSELGDADVPRELIDSPVPLQLSSDIVASALVAVKEEEVDPSTQEHKGRRNAKKGEGMNPLEVSRMLGMLKKRKLKDRACVFAYLILKKKNHIVFLNTCKGGGGNSCRGDRHPREDAGILGSPFLSCHNARTTTAMRALRLRTPFPFTPGLILARRPSS